MFLAVVDANADPLIRHWHMRTMTRDEAEEWVIAAGQDWTDESAANWAITTSSGIGGRMTLGATDLGGAEADVRYWVVPSVRDRRVASCALNALTDWAITDLGYTELNSSTPPTRCLLALSPGVLSTQVKTAQRTRRGDAEPHQEATSSSGAPHNNPRRYRHWCRSRHTTTTLKTWPLRARHARQP
jgi:hypothetical protein